MSKNTFTLGQLVAMAALTLSGSAFAAGQEGMQVVRDATTGELRAPNAAEHRALQAQAAKMKGNARSMAAPAAASMVVGTKARKGTTAYAVPEESIVYSVVTRNANGTLEQQCVTGEDAAAHATHHAAVSLHKEHKNEVQ
jgi:uncharacterized iron-regulated membrane protein